MPGNGVVALALLVAALLVAGAAGEAEERNALRRLLATREKAGQEPAAPRTRSAPVDRRTHLSEDEREVMTKQIMHAISEMVNSECVSGRDYQGWVDFGRRDTD